MTAEQFEFPRGDNDDDKVIERYGPGANEVIVWDTTSNYARIRELRREGKTVPEISAELSLKPSTVKQCLTNAIKADSAALDDDELITILGLEMDRLDHMLQAHWWAAKAGDIDSFKAVMAISRERREWLKWATPEKAVDTGITGTVLVVGGNENEFIASLDMAREQLERAQAPLDAEVVEE